jgi:hypothetical protein
MKRSFLTLVVNTIANTSISPSQLFWEVGKVNQMSAYGFIGAFAQTMKFDGSVRDVLIQTVTEMREGLDAKKQESLYNQLGRLISSFK